MKEKVLIQMLADYEHDRWARWQRYLFDKCIKNDDGSLTIPKEFVDRWNRQIYTNYYELSDEEKESDKKEAVKILDIIKKGDINE